MDVSAWEKATVPGVTPSGEVYQHRDRDAALAAEGPRVKIDTPAVDGSIRLIPFVSALVPEVDLAAGTIRLADVGGLLEDDE